MSLKDNHDKPLFEAESSAKGVKLEGARTVRSGPVFTLCFWLFADRLSVPEQRYLDVSQACALSSGLSTAGHRHEHTEAVHSQCCWSMFMSMAITKASTFLR